MFISESPITTLDEDFLNRSNFAQHLSKSLTEWKENESLVLSVNGKWGTGKTSLINMTIEAINSLDNENKPDIIKFNPWVYSENKDLLSKFIDELVKAINKSLLPNPKLVKRLEFYSRLIALSPNKEELSITYNAILSILAILGISYSQINAWFHLSNKYISNFLLILSLGYFIFNIGKQFFNKVFSIYKVKEEFKNQTIEELKEVIQNDLKKRNKKMIIVIDDIDRLSTNEIKQIFKIIRINADFPNTIYLLAFDQEIIEKNLQVQEGISGKDYLEKIVQVNFNLPHADPSCIHNYLINELNQILKDLPNTADKYFENNSHWPNIFNSGFKDYFNNIRDVKRFINSLGFNISQLYNDAVMEVNPIDFIALEAIRLFNQEYYYFILRNKTLFTSIDSEYGLSRDNRETKKKLVLDSFDSLSKENNDILKKLVFELFPQVKGFAHGPGNMSYTYSSMSEWTKDLRICSEKIFDVYFNFIPGGKDTNISQYDIHQVITASDKYETFFEILNKYKNEDANRFLMLLEMLQNYTSDSDYFKEENFEDIITALFDVSDKLPEIEKGMFDIGMDVQFLRIVYQLLKRNADLEENFQILKKATERTYSIYPALNTFQTEIQRTEKNSISELIPLDRFDDAKKICIEKLHKNIDRLLEEENLLFLLFYWINWAGKDDATLNRLLSSIMEDDSKFIVFLEKFIYETRSNSAGDYLVRRNKKFQYKNLSEFGDLNEFKERIEKINLSGKYRDHQFVIDLFLNNFKYKDKER